MHKIYEDKGNFIDFFIKKFALTQDIIIRLKREIKKDIRKRKKENKIFEQLLKIIKIKFILNGIKIINIH